MENGESNSSKQIGLLGLFKYDFWRTYFRKVVIFKFIFLIDIKEVAPPAHLNQIKHTVTVGKSKITLEIGNIINTKVNLIYIDWFYLNLYDYFFLKRLK